MKAKLHVLQKTTCFGPHRPSLGFI